MMRSKKLIIGQKHVTSDRDSLKLTIHLNWSKTSLPCKTILAETIRTKFEQMPFGLP